MRAFLQRIGVAKAGNRPSVAFEPEPYEPDVSAYTHFAEAIGRTRPGRVLEVGTLQAVPGRSTVQRKLFGSLDKIDYVCLDIQPGPDVDVVGDLHALPDEWTGSFDAFIAHAVFEHLERPWIAAKEVARVLRPGGIFHIFTHQCFPIHGYPSDFFRFSDNALRLILEDAGLSVDVCNYRNRSAIIMPKAMMVKSERQNWNRLFPSYVHVEASGHKP